MLVVHAAHTAAGGSGSPTALRIVLATTLFLAGLSVGTVGGFGLRGRLPRNRWAGVRTAATMRSDETFTVANQVAGAPLLASGAVAVVVGLLTAVMPTTASLLIVLIVGLAGTLALALVGGALGHRAAAAIPEPAASSCESGSGCAGCTALCGLR